MGTSLVRSAFVTVAWTTPKRLAHTSNISPPIPTIASVNAVSNTSPGSYFRVSPTSAIVIVGTNLNYVTSIQFQDYGLDNSDWPDYQLIPPLPTPLGIPTPDPADPFNPVFVLDSDTQITIPVTSVQSLLTNYWIGTNVWLKLVLNY